MKILYIPVLILFCVKILYAQDIFTFPNYIASISGQRLTITDFSNNIVYERNYLNPNPYLADLDQDGNSEFLINDAEERNSRIFYTLYIYNTIDSFYLVDSIYSGLKEPYYDYSDEVKSLIIISGSPDFDSLNLFGNNDFSFSPVVCWSFQGNELNIINDQLYDIYLSENEKYIDIIDSVYKTKGSSCEVTQSIIPVIAVVYANYYNASEIASAEKVLSTYYLCDDRKKFRENLKKLL